MAQSPTFRCLMCGGFHGRSLHKAMCPDCFKKWKAEVEDLAKLVRSLAADPSDFPGHLHKVIDEIEKKLKKMRESFKRP